MKIMSKGILTLVGIAALIPGISAQQTKILTADKHNEYGLVYTLPVTALKVEVSARRTSSVAGPYWQYAKKYIGTDDVVRENNVQWEITGVKVTPYGVPDTEKQYMMTFKPGALTYIAVSDGDMILSINKEVEAPVVDLAGPAWMRRREPNIDAYLQYVDEDFISSQSSAKRAQMLAQNLMEVRDARVSLTRGTAESMPTDGRQLELMLESLATQEAAFTAAFKGLTDEMQVTSIYTYVPGAEGGKDILFRMSDFAGFVDKDDYAGDPVYIEVTDVKSGELPVDAKGEVKKLPKDAVIYNIPGVANVTVKYKGDTLWSGRQEFAQSGIQFGLAPALFSDKKARSYAIFDPATGALKEIGDINAE